MTIPYCWLFALSTILLETLWSSGCSRFCCFSPYLEKIRVLIRVSFLWNRLLTQRYMDLVWVTFDRSYRHTILSIDAVVTLSRLISIPTYPSGAISIVSFE